MKPLQIALLVIAGALSGAIVMKMAERFRPVPVVTAYVPPEPSQPASAQTLAPQPGAPPTTLPEAPSAALPAEHAPVPEAALPKPSAHPSPFDQRAAASKPRPVVTHPRPPIVARVRPMYVPPQSATVVHPAQPVSTIAPPPTPSPTNSQALPPVAEPAPQPEPSASTLPPARSEAENATPPSPVVATPPAPPPPPPNRATLNAGLLIPVRLIDGLSSERNQPGDTFHATLEKELVADGFVIAERGARVEGRVVAADRGGKFNGVASLAVALTVIHTSDGQAMPVRTDPFNRHANASHWQDAEKIGGAAAFGAIVGALAGGGKGAAAGAGVGVGAGAAAVALTRGDAATLPSETRIAFRLKIPVTITEHR